jgi:4-amino-4-deoxy-L-arabinose transferase-like glycosyltransferase
MRYHDERSRKVNLVQKRWPSIALKIAAPLTVAVVGLVVAIRFNSTSDHLPQALVGWIVSWLFTLIAIAGWEKSKGRPVFGRPGPDQPRWRRTEIIAVVVIIVAAALLRMVALEDYPIALHNDEMSCMIEARGFLESETGLFSTGWFGCPNLGFFLTSIFLRILGPSLLALRLSSVFLSLVSLVGTYLLVRRLFGVRPALLLLLLTTPFHWHLHFSRTGFHYMQAASLTVVAVLLFAIAIDRRSPVLFGCSGVIIGIAFQTYYAAWLTPLILGAWAVTRLLSDGEQGKTAIKGYVVAMVLFIVTLAPLLAYYVHLPDGVTSRTRQVFLFSEKNRVHVKASYGTSDPTKLLTMNAVRFGRFLVGDVGDGSVQYGLQGRFFDPYLLPFILAGLAYSLSLIRRPGGQLLWIWFLGTLIAGGLLTIDAVFSPRLIGITVIVLLFPALLIDRLLRVRWIADRRWLKATATLILGAIFVGSTWWNLETTFVRYPPKSRIGNRDRIIRVASDLGNVTTIVNFSDPEEFDHQAYRALIPAVEGKNLRRGEESISNATATVEAYRPRALVVVPLWDEELYGLCDEIGARPRGIVITGQGSRGFEWCFVE